MNKQSTKSFLMGIGASAFFAVTFVINRLMNLEGGYWMWGAALRYFFMAIILLVIMVVRGKLAGIINAIKKDPLSWILWSTVGFGIFYAPLSFASAYGESWLIASTWQITIVCGILITPMFGKKIPYKNLAISLLILAGIFVMQAAYIKTAENINPLMTVIPIVIAAFAYPMGNRKVMQHTPDDIDTMQRIFGMTICSLPFWVVIAAVAFVRSGAPASGQCIQSGLVALFSGTIATSLFFHATDVVKKNPRHLALVEATQSGEVIFTLIGGLLFLGDAAPSAYGLAGIAMIIAGMIIGNLVS